MAKRQPGMTMMARAEEYLAFRRKIGFALEAPGRALLAFARYADRNGHGGPVTTEIAIRWATLPGKGESRAAVKKLEAVRQFAKYQVQFDPRTEVPPHGILGPGYRRRVPHIYTDEEIAALLRALGEPPGQLPSQSVVTLFSLLFATGLRLGEAVRLRCADVDLDEGLIHVLKTKFRKSRLVPLHPSTTRELRLYARLRDRSRAQDAGGAFFFDGRHRVTSMAVKRALARARRDLGWGEESGDKRGERASDTRHTFAVRRLLRWYEEGANVDEKISSLSTYLGHVRVTDTYWYMTASPELLALGGKRFERYADSRREGREK
ncbi:MAG: tyrosine-type recombinase/integrase [Proteobacteria bacterium]|nr:tyrosine-type recombinase/integrase [Pseudomonadota bacterium]